MKQCTIIGKTNVGKTLFLINFSEYLGVKNFNINFLYSNGSEKSISYSYKNAISQLVDKNPHKTLCIQEITLNVPVGKGKKKIKIVDTAGLLDGIHPDVEVRKSISQALSIIRNSDIILHIIDASATKDKDLPNSMGEVDYQIAQFAQLKRGYAILANKMDLPAAEEGLKKIKEEFPGHVIFPISALYKRGFKEVKTFVVRNS